MSHNTPTISISTLQAELAGESICFPLPSLTTIAAGEQELAANGQSGFGDLATGATIVQLDNWHDFTARFVQYCEALGFDPNYCQLALAMGKADRNQFTWEHYLNLACVCSTYFFEVGNPRLFRLKLALEEGGWVFTFHGAYWQADISGIEIRGATLTETVANIEAYGIPALQMREDHVTAER